MPRNVVPYSSSGKAHARARERRRWLERVLEQEREGPVRRVVFESPPDDSQAELPGIGEDESEARGQLARLRWQQSADALLLLERTADAVLATLQKRFRLGDYPPELAIKLSPLRSVFRRGLFPWRVVVCTHDDTALERRLKDLTDWLGIGVDIEEPATARPLGRCRNGYDAQDGVVGGIVRLDRPYAITCRHVVSTDCGSVANSRLRRSGVPDAPTGAVLLAPDAVLLEAMTPCFPVPPDDVAPISPATTTWLEHCMVKRTPVEKASKRSASRTTGVVRSLVSVVTVGEHLFRFPHIEVIPRRSAYLFGLIKAPLLGRDFSVPGESGTWLVDTESRMWLGMVVAGDDLGSTYAVEAAALVEYLKLVTGATGSAVSTTWPRQPG